MPGRIIMDPRWQYSFSTGTCGRISPAVLRRGFLDLQYQDTPGLKRLGIVRREGSQLMASDLLAMIRLIRVHPSDHVKTASRHSKGVVDSKDLQRPLGPPSRPKD
jgi:hypothetical protein